MSAVILALFVLLLLLFLVPVASLGFVRRRRLRVANDKVQPAIRASHEKFSQPLGLATETRLSVLIENHKDDKLTELIAEHGLSIHIEHDGRAFLFDTGLSGAVVRNAQRMDVDLGNLEAVVISHGHRDHGGGLGAVSEVNDKALIYLGKGALADRYSPLFWFRKIPIGLDARTIETISDRLRYVESTTEIFPGVTIITGLKGSQPAPLDRGTLLKRENGRLIADNFIDEIALAIQTHDGLVVLSGCGHNGVLNLLDLVRRQFHSVPIKMLVGGFHLMNPRRLEMSESKEKIKRLGQALMNSGVRYFVTGHCTGVDAFMILKSVMKDRLEYISTGSRILL